MASLGRGRSVNLKSGITSPDLPRLGRLTELEQRIQRSVNSSTEYRGEYLRDNKFTLLIEL